MKRVISILVSLAALFVIAAPAMAAKPVIGVAEFRNTSGAGWWYGGVGWDLASMVSNELASTGSFRVVERSKLEPVLREQDLAASGRVSKGTGAKIGNLTGAQYLVMGTVTAYQEKVGGGGGGFSYKGIAIGGKKEEAYMAVDLRVVDTTTGELAHVRSIEGRAKSGGLNLGLNRSGFSGRLGQYKKTPAGKAIRAAVVEITDYLDCVMVAQDSCMADFDAKERKRRSGLKDAIELD